jgi:glycosyltransferase involved in cell wall biosynthesis
MKIAILGARRFPPKMSGIDKQVYNLSISLEGMGHEVFVFVAEKAGRSPKNIHVIKVPSINIELSDISMSYLSYNMLSVPKVVSVVRKKKINVLHANNPPSGAIAYMVKKLTGVPVVYTLRGTIPDNREARGRIVSKPLSIMERMALRAADVSTALTAHIKSTTESYHRRKLKMVVIPNGIDVGVKGKPGKIRKEFGLESGHKVVTFVGRLVGVKGLKYLIDAMKGVSKACPEARLLVVGGGPIRGSLEAQAETCGVKDKVIFTGPRTDVADILEDSDLLVLPSLHEGFPNVVLEAMAAGRPVVATRVTSNPEIVKRSFGKLAEPRDPDSLEKAIIGMLRDGNLERMGRAALKESEGYSWKNISKKFEAVFKEVAR